MNLRLLRKKQWVNTNTALGGSPQWQIRHHDVLQYERAPNHWVDVPVEVEPDPPHPEAIEHEKFLVTMQPMVDQIVEQMNKKAGSKKAK